MAPGTVVGITVSRYSVIDKYHTDVGLISTTCNSPTDVLILCAQAFCHDVFLLAWWIWTL